MRKPKKMSERLYHVTEGEVFRELGKIPSNSHDGVFCDPPYGIGMMGKKWDQSVPGVGVWREMLRVCKPGAYMLAFGSPKTFHGLTCHIEDAGWKIVDTICWLYGGGFPKSNDFAKRIRQFQGHSRTAHQFRGRGTSLKPAWEPIVLAMKPVDNSYAKNAAVYGCGGLNIDECRIGPNGIAQNEKGRWPANLMLDEEAAMLLDEQSGWSRSTRGKRRSARSLPGNGRTMGYFRLRQDGDGGYEDEGGASRFFYVPKAKGKERKGNDHPAVKPITLCEYLARLILPPKRETSRCLLVPFSGSGSEMIGAINAGWDHVRGIERSNKYAKLSRERLRNRKTQDQPKIVGSEENMMKEDLLMRAKKLARRVTKEETMQGNLLMFSQLGLDQVDLEQMAKGVGLELDDLLLLHPSDVLTRQPQPSPPGRPGRKDETRDIAEFANDRRPKMTWEEIYLEWIRKFPNDTRVRNKESVREAHRRYFGDKAKQKKKP